MTTFCIQIEEKHKVTKNIKAYKEEGTQRAYEKWDGDEENKE